MLLGRKLKSNMSLMEPSFSDILIALHVFKLRGAAQAVGELDLESKFAGASESLRRGIMFANSLYL